MLEIVARTSNNSDVLLNLAQKYLDRHEWGRARMLLEQLHAADCPNSAGRVEKLLQDTLERLDINTDNDSSF